MKNVLSVAIMLLLTAGCADMSGLLLSPAPSEQSVPAEFNLREQKDKSVLVMVDESIGSGADPAVIRALSTAVVLNLQKQVKIKPDNILIPKEVSESGTGVSDIYRMGPIDAGQRADADFVLFVTIVDYELYTAGYKDYYTGELAARSLLYEVRTGEKVWPRESGGRVSRVRIELETKGRQVIFSDLVSSTAHCITRYLYNCNYRRFKTAYEQVDYMNLNDF